MDYKNMTPEEILRVMECYDTTDREQALVDALSDVLDELSAWEEAAREGFDAEDSVELTG